MATTFISSVPNTSTIPLGADAASMEASTSTISTGNIILANTAITAASTVLNIYRIITVRMTPPWLCLALHKELMTRKNTRSGAIPFSALTNTSPKIPIPDTPGTTIARITPIDNPMIILCTRLIYVHFSHIFFMIPSI